VGRDEGLAAEVGEEPSKSSRATGLEIQSWRDPQGTACPERYWGQLKAAKPGVGCGGKTWPPRAHQPLMGNVAGRSGSKGPAPRIRS
jgi:hypothetical protein